MDGPTRFQNASLVALLLLLGAVAVFVAWAGGADPGVGMTEVQSPGAVLAADASVASGGDAARGITEGAASSRDAERTAIAAGIAPARPFPPGARWVEFTVVDAATGDPVPGADVRWFDETAHELLSVQFGGWTSELQMLLLRAEEVADRTGWKTFADAQGKARVTVRDLAFVVAMHEGRYGRMQLRDNTVPPRDGYRLELVADRSVAVQVVDGNGRPCIGVPVTMLLMGGDESQRNVGDLQPLATTAAPDGIARIDHIQCLGEVLSGAPLVPERVGPRLCLPGSSIDGPDFAYDRLPLEPVVLRMPPVGSLRVRAELAGRPAPGFQHVWLSCEDPEETLDATMMQSVSMVSVGADGTARFPFVLLGRRWNVYTEAGGGMWRTVAGPITPGQELEVVLTAEEHAAMLSGRLVDSSREPLRDQAFSFAADGDGFWQRVDGRTDGEGRFVVLVGSFEEPAQSARMTFDVQRQDASPLHAAIPPRVLREGIEELGDVLVGEAPLLVAGAIVCEGRPLPKGIYLEVQRLWPSEDGSEPQWGQAGEQYPFVDDQGRFSVRGESAPGRHRLAVMHDQFLPVDPVEFSLGATDVTVTIATCHALAASFLVPDDAPLHQLHCVLVPSAGGPRGEVQGRDVLQAFLERAAADRADARWPALPPGRYSLQVRNWASRAPVLTVDDVEVPRADGLDPRLVDIDLRSLLRIVDVRCLDHEGAPIVDESGMVFVVQGRGEPWLGVETWGETSGLLLPRGPYDLLVCVRGYRPRSVHADADRLDVRLDPWPRVVVHVPGVPALGENRTLSVGLHAAQAASQPFQARWGQYQADEFLAPSGSEQVVDGRCEVAIGDGPHTLSLCLSGQRSSVTIKASSPAQVLPTDAAVTVSVSAAQWTSALEQLAREEQAAK